MPKRALLLMASRLVGPGVMEATTANTRKGSRAIKAGSPEGGFESQSALRFSAEQTAPGRQGPERVPGNAPGNAPCNAPCAVLTVPYSAASANFYSTLPQEVRFHKIIVETSTL